MKSRPFGAATVASLFTAITMIWPSDGASAPQKRLRVGLLADNEHDGEIARSYAATFAEVASAGEVEVIDLQGRRAGSTPESVRAAFEALLADKTVDAIATLGPIGSAEAVHRTNLAKPVIAADVVDPKLFGAPRGQGDASGVRNLAYVTDSGALGRDLALIRDLGFQRPALLVGKNALQGIPGLAAQLIERAKSVNLAATVVPVAADHPRATQIGNADAAVLMLLDELPQQAVSELCAALLEKKTRIYSARGVQDLKSGAAVSLADAKDLAQKTRRVAINMLRIAGGEGASSLAVSYQRSETLTFNLESVGKAGWTPPYALISAAETIGEAVVEAQGEKIDLRGVAEEVVKKNLDFEAGRLQNESQSEDVDRAFSLLLPQASASLEGILIDPKRAQATFGLQPQRQLLGVLEGKMIVFSDKVWANLSIQRKLVLVRGLQRDAQRLDLVLEAAKGYLTVLQARVLERVRLENVKRTQANLSHATTKKTVGSAMPTEVLRWQSQIAIDRREVLKARSMRKLAEMQLNRLRHRPLEEAFTTEAEKLESEMKNLSIDQLLPYLDDEHAFGALRAFLVEDGLKNSAELRAVDEAIEASDRAVSAAWRTVYVPTLGAVAQADYFFAKGGKGTGPPDVAAALPPMFQGIAPSIQSILPPPIGNFVWSVAGVLSLPLPIDMAVFSDIRRAESDLAQRHIERDAAQEKIEQRIRSAAYLVASSLPGVKLAKASAEAAQKNLTIAQEAYGAGAIGVLDVLDAQNLALVADQLAVSAEFDYMIDQIQLERSVGAYYFVKGKDERDAWLRSAIDYLQKHRSSAP
jgi:outer membrane protein TolC